jgi:hypothetical protein
MLYGVEARIYQNYGNMDLVQFLPYTFVHITS